MSAIKKIFDKMYISAKLEVKTGLHIGASNDFASIGMVDSVVIRDPLTKKPIIPGSSIKGKMRSLLARVDTDKAYGHKLEDESDELKHLFGSSNPVIAARLQFYDLFMNEDSFKKVKDLATDLYLTEIKFENTIDRLTATANPRQIERVPAGTVFDFKLVYNVEDYDDMEKDMKILKRGIELLQNDYLGGSGTRGYGRIEMTDFKVKSCNLNKNDFIDEEKLGRILNG